MSSTFRNTARIQASIVGDFGEVVARAVPSLCTVIRTLIDVVGAHSSSNRRAFLSSNSRLFLKPSCFGPGIGRRTGDVDEERNADEPHHDTEADEQVDAARRRQVAVREDAEVQDRIGGASLPQQEQREGHDSAGHPEQPVLRRSGRRSLHADFRRAQSDVHQDQRGQRWSHIPAENQRIEDDEKGEIDVGVNQKWQRAGRFTRHIHQRKQTQCQDHYATDHGRH